jgi:Fe-Mn family superoxide dismutase
MNEAITPAELARLLDENSDVKILDVRRRADRVDVAYPVPGAEWRDPEQIAEWAGGLEKHDEVIVYCVHGHNVGKGARDYLRAHGMNARMLEGGIEAWQAFSKGS